MTAQNVNSECLQAGRKLDTMLDELWEMSKDASPSEVRQAAKLAREMMIKDGKDPVVAKVWREIMDMFFTLLVSKSNLLLV